MKFALNYYLLGTTFPYILTFLKPVQPFPVDSIREFHDDFTVPFTNISAEAHKRVRRRFIIRCCGSWSCTYSSRAQNPPQTLRRGNSWDRWPNLFNNPEKDNRDFGGSEEFGDRAVATLKDGGISISCPGCSSGWQSNLKIGPDLGHIPITCPGCESNWRSWLSPEGYAAALTPTTPEPDDASTQEGEETSVEEPTTEVTTTTKRAKAGKIKKKTKKPPITKTTLNATTASTRPPGSIITQPLTRPPRQPKPPTLTAAPPSPIVTATSTQSPKPQPAPLTSAPLIQTAAPLPQTAASPAPISIASPAVPPPAPTLAPNSAPSAAPEVLTQPTTPAPTPPPTPPPTAAPATISPATTANMLAGIGITLPTGIPDLGAMAGAAGKFLPPGVTIPTDLAAAAGAAGKMLPPGVTMPTDLAGAAGMAGKYLPPGVTIPTDLAGAAKLIPKDFNPFSLFGR